MSQYRIVFLGDIVGRPGREAVLAAIPRLREELQPLFLLANGENSAAGVGITPSIADELFDAGVDAITLGNHAFHKREIVPYLDSGRPIVRPANMPIEVPGNGWVIVEKAGIKLAIVNLCGRTFLDGYNDPFAEFERIVGALPTRHVFVDFHAEATSEKQAFGFGAAGRVTAVVGTHTHVPTADETVLEGGTAYISDVGMCGPYPSVLGMDKDVILRRFRTSLPTRFEVASTSGVICGVVIDVLMDTGRAVAIRRIGGLTLE